MLKKISFGLVGLAAFLVPSLAFAQDLDPEDLGALIPAVVAAAKGGEWSVFAALVIMILVFLATKIPFVDNLLPKGAKPWVATIAGVLAAVAGTAFTTGDWMQAILGGLVTGAAASGLWELVGKHFMKSKAEEVTVEEV
jgi:hypothetical protein